MLVPVRDEAPYLAQALASLAAQALAEIEVIVVDDGSVDDCAMSDADALADVTGDVVVYMDDAAVLHVAVVADGDDIAVAADRCVRPDRHARPDGDVPRHIRERMDEAGGVGFRRRHGRCWVIGARWKVLMTDPNPYHCPVCDAKFASIEDVERHKSQSHRSQTHNTQKQQETPKPRAAKSRQNREFTRGHME